MKELKFRTAASGISKRCRGQLIIVKILHISTYNMDKIDIQLLHI